MKRKWQFFVIAIASFALDQASKYWLISVTELPTQSPMALCPYFSLVMTWNRGISFSMLSTAAAWMPYVLVAMACVISAILVRLAMRSPHRLEQMGYALVVGGALGNALDRVRFGAVADFFYAHIGDLGWPAFNVADSSIFCGVLLLLGCMLKKPASA